MTFNFAGFKILAQATQENLRRYLLKQLKKLYKDVEEGDRYIFCKGEAPILLVAHLDTVHHDLPTKIFYDKENAAMTSPQGIGGDDRCGVYIVICALKYSQKRPSVLFTMDEEIGCVGAKEAMRKIDPKGMFNYLIEVDRHGDNEVVFYDTKNAEFIEYVKSFGLKEEIGASSDVKHLSNEWNIASCNICAGYHCEHKLNEWVNVKAMMNSAQIVVDMIGDVAKSKPWKRT